VNLDAVLKYQFSPIEETYTFKDSILYALGLGYGEDPLDREELRFVTEEEQRVVPTQSNVLCYPGFWMRDVPELGFDWLRVLHGEQMIKLMRPLPTSATVKAIVRIIAIDDKGEHKGAAVYLEREICLADSGEPLALVRSTVFARGDGGQGGFGNAPDAPTPLDRFDPDCICEFTSSPRAALIYRLSGDYNPIHSNPDSAREAGFERPILHGMCTMGMACRAILQQFCDYHPKLLRSMFVRFSQPIMPGETIRFEFFKERDGVSFRARSVERDVIVLDRCRAEISS